MNFHVMTLFPDMIMQGLSTSIIGRAVEKNYIGIEAVDIRDYTLDKHGKVDDYPYGGGAGMLMQAQPVFDCHKAIQDKIGHKARVIFMTPKGRTFNQSTAEELSKEEDLIILCGHYEGIDERVLEEIVTDEISIGDYVLTGGEMAAMVVIDAVSRLVPGVLSNEESGITESFSGSLLEYPQYSRPEIWMGKKIPDVLLSGNHKEVEKWRLEKAIEVTRQKRPDLYEKYQRECEIVEFLNKDKAVNTDMTEALIGSKMRLIYDKDDVICLSDSTKENLLLYVHSPEGLNDFFDFINKIKPEGPVKITLRGIDTDISEFGYKLVKKALLSTYTRGVPISAREAKGETAAKVTKETNEKLLTERYPFFEVNPDDEETLEVYRNFQFRISKKMLYFWERLC
ncbi:MAG: tRNA (guanosine(37)-N1)-methyltransferase TrmD [Lachnospiraceae bacterium]|nr:tRNA (guanosine(37)-N1)-methyltransferase TrmD [Lachnospiraceae bacterium]